MVRSKDAGTTIAGINNDSNARLLESAAFIEQQDSVGGSKCEVSGWKVNRDVHFELHGDLTRDQRDSAASIRNIGIIRNKRERGCSLKSFVSSISGKSVFEANGGECSGGIFGREEEISILFDVFHRVLGGSSEVVTVSGISGVGKSCLIESLRSPVSAVDGYFCHGKYDILRSSEPFSAIACAFTELCDLVLQSDELSAYRSAVNDALGEETETLASLISNVSCLTQRQYEHSNLKSNTTQAVTRFKSNMKAFLRAVATPTHPILLFLDDIQFANDEDIDLIKALITDPESKNVLIVLAFRDNEIVTDSIFSQFVDNLSSSHQIIATTSISLGNMTIDGVNMMVASVLGSSCDATLDLSNVIWNKTLGHPYCVAQFIESLKSKGLVRYSHDFEWEWDVERVQSETNVSENIAALLEERVHRLTNDARSLLQLAACLGHTFDMELLKKLSLWEKCFVSDHDHDDDMVTSNVRHTERFSQVLGLTMKEGLIERTRRDQLKMAHDKLQEYLLEMRGSEARELLHLRVGNHVMSLCDSSQPSNDSMFFLAVDQLNRGAKRLVNVKEKTDLIHFNIRAGEKAKSKYAFLSAAQYLRSALALFDQPDRWTTNYTLCMRVYNASVEYECCCGNYSASKELTCGIIRHARSLQDKLQAYTILISSFGAQGKLSEAITLGISILRELGERFPTRPSMIRVAYEILQSKWRVNGKSEADLLSLPEMKNASKVAAMEILTTLANFAFLQENNLHFPMILARMMTITLQYGLSNGAIQCFAAWSLFETMTGNRGQGHRFGRLSLILAEKRSANKELVGAACIVYSFSNHILRPVRESIEAFHVATSQGFQFGEIYYALTASYSRVGCEFLCGYRPLRELESETRHVHDRIVEYGHEALRLLITSSWQCIQNMMGLARDSRLLNGDVMEYAAVIREATDTKNDAAMYAIFYSEFKLAVWFGAWDLAYEALKNMERNTRTMRAMLVYFSMMELQLFSGLVYLERARTTSRRKYRLRAKQITKRMQLYLSEGRMDCRPFVLFLEAETARLEKLSTKTVQHAYNQAIIAFAEGGFQNFEALANERAGRFSIERQDVRAATRYFVEAQVLYRRWDALAKVDECEIIVERMIMFG